MISVKNATEVEIIGIFKKNKQSVILMHSENTGHKIYQWKAKEKYWQCLVYNNS